VSLRLALLAFILAAPAAVAGTVLLSHECTVVRGEGAYCNTKTPLMALHEDCPGPCERQAAFVEAGLLAHDALQEQGFCYDATPWPCERWGAPIEYEFSCARGAEGAGSRTCRASAALP
jgi:hypothetical protein